MSFPTYLQNKQKKIESKYHQVAKQFESKYELVHQRVKSRFHSESIETEVVRSTLNNFTTKSKLSIDKKIKESICTLSQTFTKKVDNPYYENIDWTRGRFSGETIQVVVRDGKVIEKVFLTPKGNRISVKRSELGLWFRKNWMILR